MRQGKQVKAEPSTNLPGVCAPHLLRSLCKDFCKQCGIEIEVIEEPGKCFWCILPLCWKCWENGFGQCIKCARTLAETPAVAARRLQAYRKVRAGGRPRKLRRCAVCAKFMGVRELRAHAKECKAAAKIAKAEVA
jgi:hypothetical protein